MRVETLGDMTGHVLFYSELCFFSKDIRALITKKNISALFTFVSVDTYRASLPVFVQSVPTIFTRDKQVLEGEAAFDMVDNIQPSRIHHNGGMQGGGGADRGTSTSRGAVGQGQCHGQGQVGSPHTETGSLIECSTHDLSGSSWSDGFAFLEPDQGQSMGLVSGMSAFSSLSEDTSIPLVPEPTGNGDSRRGEGQGQGQGNGFGSGPPSALEAYTSKRDNDTATLRQNQLGEGAHQQQRRT